MIILCGFYGLVFLPAYLRLMGGQKLPSSKPGRLLSADVVDHDIGSVSQSSVLNPFTINNTNNTTVN